MVRNYKRKTVTTYTKNDFETAVKMISARVRKVKLTVYSVAKQFNIPRSTLTKHIKKNYNQYLIFPMLHLICQLL